MGNVQKYDLYIVNPARGDAPQSTPANVPDDRLKQRGWLRLGVDLETARGVMRQIRARSGNAYVVAEEYRSPRITQDQAHRTALEIHERLSGSGRRLAPFSVFIDDITCWTFVADDLDAIEREEIPGQLRLSVDKLSGRVRTEEEFQEWLRLSKL